MSYLTCLHCERRFAKPSKRRYCSVLCKNAVAKADAKARLADERWHAEHTSQPTFVLTDLECLKIEARYTRKKITSLSISLVTRSRTVTRKPALRTSTGCMRRGLPRVLISTCWAAAQTRP